MIDRLGTIIIWRITHTHSNSCSLELLLSYIDSCSPSSWAHRKYVVGKLVDKITEQKNIDKDTFALIVTLFQEEICSCIQVAERYPKNYYAWTHRRYLLGQLRDLVLQNNNNQLAHIYMSLLQNEWSLILNWLTTHTSDNSAVHYGGQVLEFWLESIPDDDDTSIQEVMTGTLQSARDLVDRYQDHEALWMFRRIVVVTVMRYCSQKTNAMQAILAILWNQDIEQVHNSTITNRDCSAKLDRPDHAWSYIMWVLVQMRLLLLEAPPTTTTTMTAPEEAAEIYGKTLAALRENDNAIGHCMWQSHQTFDV